MEFVVKSGAAAKQKTGCLVIGVQAEKSLATASAIDTASQGYLSQILKRGDLLFKAGQSLLLQHLPNTACERLLLTALGETSASHVQTNHESPLQTAEPTALSERDYHKVLTQIITQLKQTGAKDAVIAMDDFAVADSDLFRNARQLVESFAHQLYRFQVLKSKTEQAKDKPPVLQKITLLVQQRQSVATVQTAIDQGQAIAKGKNLARTLGNLPGNLCHPAYLAHEAKNLAKQHSKLTTQVLGEKQMRALAMNALLSVSAGSEQEAQLIVMDYKNGKPNAKPIVLIGKGITFDSGGISLKPAATMDEMKFDMGGAASIFGVLQAIIALNLPLNVIGIVAAAENMPSGTASRPGDVVTAMAGKTIEILNTDAEGRLVLCDAMTYAERYQPAAVVDVATLTGACVIALGHSISGLLSNNDTLADALLAAGQYAADRAWRLPMNEDYQQQLDSTVADMANVGGRPAGTITAACFLSRFAENYPWAHLDIAGTAWVSGKHKKGATGRPVALLVQYLLDQVDR